MVTGASSGIGRSLVYEFCGSGGNIVLGVGRSEESLRRIRSVFSNCFNYVVADLSDLRSIDVVVNSARDFLGSIDVLINNAGFGLYKDVLSHSVDEVYSLAMVNFVAPIALIIKLLPLMHPGSTVVNMITAGVHVLMSRMPIYGASKIALHYASEALRRELDRYNINMISVYPGYIATEFHIRAGAREIKRGVPPDRVAKEIIRALRKRKKYVYIPTHLNILRILGPHLIKM